MAISISESATKALFNTSVIRRLWSYVPLGGSLPEGVWRQRHHFLLGLTCLHALIIASLGPLLGYSWELSGSALFEDRTVAHTFGEGLLVAMFAAIATCMRKSRQLQASMVALGLMSSSAILVHLSGGYIELHFHFFVMLSFLALYQDWIPYLLAIVYVAIHHGVVGVIWPEEVYNHIAAVNAPWLWASIHAFFVLWAAVGSVIAWRFNERAFAQTKLILDSAGEGIFGLDQQGKITFVNPAGASLLGWAANEVIGQAMHRILRHAKADGTVFFDNASPVLAALRDGMRRQATDELFWRKDGTCFLVEYTCTPIFEREEVTGVVVTFRDISRRKQRELALRESEERFRQIAENIKEVFWVIDPMKNERLYVSPAYQEVWGRDPSKVVSLSQSWLGFIHPDDLGRVLAAVMTKQVTGQYDEEYRILRPDGSIRWVRDRAFPVKNESGKVYRIIGIAEDITKAKQAEEELWSRYKELAILHEASQVSLRSKDLKLVLGKILELALSAVSLEIGNIRLFEHSGHMRVAAYRGYSHPQNLYPHDTAVEGPENDVLTSRVIATGKSLVVEDITRTEGLLTFKKEGVCSAIVVPITTQAETLGVIAVGSRTASRFRPDDVRLLESIGNQVGIAVQKARLLEEAERRAQEQEALNVVAKAVSQSLNRDELLQIALEKILHVTGRERGSIRLKDSVSGQVTLAAHRGFSHAEVEELLRRKSHTVSEQVFATGQPQVINDSTESSDRLSLLPQSHSVAWIPIKTRTKVVGVLGVSASRPIPFESHELELLQAIGNMIGVALQKSRLYEETKRAQTALAGKAEELSRSNTELEHFAYIASHDLQEPLRMVSSYVQLLARRYKGKLDDDANEFIAYAVDGATRMQALINALLAYSRIGTKGKPFAPIACQEIFESALKILKISIEESKAIVTHDPLPIVNGDDVQLAQLFQNLIGNAIKFRGDSPPVIHVTAERHGKEWVFSFRDNGIGIDPEYFERIFIIFQRLHSKQEYPGTGIGLALCKKIVERHGGRIWVESAAGKGATFRFSIPCEPYNIEGEKNDVQA